MAEEKKKVKKKEEAKASDLPKLSKEAEKVLETVEKMTVLELADLVEVMEEKFGVSASAPVAVAAAPAEEDKGEEKSAFDIVLKDAGDKKIDVIKVIREITDLGLMEAKKMTEEAPQTVKEAVAKDEAEDFKKKFEEAGATVELE